MDCTISITNNVLIKNISGLTDSNNFLKKEIITRMLAITAIFFRTIDTLANIGLGVVKLGGHLLRRIGIKAIHSDSVSHEAILCCFDAARDAIFSEPLLLFKLLNSPKRFIDSQKKMERWLSMKIPHRALAHQDLSTRSGS